MNELLFILTIILYFGGMLLTKKFWGKTGLYIWIVIGTVFANIEINKLVNIFGMEMTLGNVLFASTFLVTDVISECYGKENSKKAVNIGVFSSVCLIVITQIALLFTPSANDTMQGYLQGVFGQIPRICLASFLVYMIVQRFDVWMYHKIWNFTAKKSGSRKKYLWLRNNGSTCMSQLINNFLFTFGAFFGTYDMGTLISITISSYVIGLMLALLDTPFMYLARKIKSKDDASNSENEVIVRKVVS